MTTTQMLDSLNREQLAALYAELIGYDPFKDDPAMTEGLVRDLLRGYFAVIALGGLES